jgi:hypothetical protein
MKIQDELTNFDRFDLRVINLGIRTVELIKRRKTLIKDIKESDKLTQEEKNILVARILDIETLN